VKPPAGERAAIALLARLLRAAPPGHGVELGIGDDAAVLRAGAERWVWTIDACIEGVHFDLRYLDLVDVGYRSLMAAASDLAAMGAAPIGALAELGLPKAATPRAVRAIGRGQALAAKAIGCPVIGGNLSRSTEISVVTTVIGRAKRPLLRRGARAGDDLYLVGEVGLAAFGLELLRRQRRVQSASERSAIAAWRRPLARIRDGLGLARSAHAAIDVSDGLAGDAEHVARASGVRLVLEASALEALLGSAMTRAMRHRGLDPLGLALAGGEDYALLIAARRAPKRSTRIGRVERGRGVVIEHADGTRARWTGGGFDHLR